MLCCRIMIPMLPILIYKVFVLFAFFIVGRGPVPRQPYCPGRTIDKYFIPPNTSSRCKFRDDMLSY